MDARKSNGRPTPGMFYLVVGSSGVGKDTLIVGARRWLHKAEGSALAGCVFAQRIITRPLTQPLPPEGERHQPVDESTFDTLVKSGALLADWSAHGYRYGLSMALHSMLLAGHDVIANGSRTAVRQLAQRVPRLTVIQIEARPDVVADRLTHRGRESAQVVAQRMARKVEPDVPEGVRWVHLRNEGSIAEGVQALLQVMRGDRPSDSEYARISEFAML